MLLSDMTTVHSAPLGPTAIHTLGDPADADGATGASIAQWRLKDEFAALVDLPPGRAGPPNDFLSRTPWGDRGPAQPWSMEFLDAGSYGTVRKGRSRRHHGGLLCHPGYAPDAAAPCARRPQPRRLRYAQVTAKARAACLSLWRAFARRLTSTCASETVDIAGRRFKARFRTSLKPSTHLIGDHGYNYRVDGPGYSAARAAGGLPEIPETNRRPRSAAAELLHDQQGVRRGDRLHVRHPFRHGSGVGPHHLSHGDCVRVFERAIIHPGVRYEVVFGVSDSNWPMYDLDHGRRVLGYEPQDRAEVPPEEWDT